MTEYLHMMSYMQDVFIGFTAYSVLGLQTFLGGGGYFVCGYLHRLFITPFSPAPIL
jgi:hypothetical protein